MLSVARRPVGALSGVCAWCSGNARARVVPEATGVVIEPGIGKGRNLPLYDPHKVTVVHGVDPDAASLGQAERKADGVRLELHQSIAEDLPFDTASADTVVLTYTVCALGDVQRALSEVRRVLKPSGRLLFCEHGRSHDRPVARMQDRLDGFWTRYGGGCHLNRDVAALLGEGGFRITWLETFYANRALPALTFHYTGAAVPA
ncbi:MAG: class I SAM-dependent methyltransferase [Hyphomicrobiales bacterium]